MVEEPTIVMVRAQLAMGSGHSGIESSRSSSLPIMDISAAKAVVNFHFWTGQHTDLHSIRESLDEYCQW